MGLLSILRYFLHLEVIADFQYFQDFSFKFTTELVAMWHHRSLLNENTNYENFSMVVHNLAMPPMTVTTDSGHIFQPKQQQFNILKSHDICQIVVP